MRRGGGAAAASGRAAGGGCAPPSPIKEAAPLPPRAKAAAALLSPSHPGHQVSFPLARNPPSVPPPPPGPRKLRCSGRRRANRAAAECLCAKSGPLTTTFAREPNLPQDLPSLPGKAAARKGNFSPCAQKDFRAARRVSAGEQCGRTDGRREKLLLKGRVPPAEALRSCGLGWAKNEPARLPTFPSRPPWACSRTPDLGLVAGLKLGKSGRGLLAALTESLGF